MAGLFRTLAMFLSNPLYSSYHPGSCCLRKSRSVLPHICFVCFEEIQPSRVLQLSPWRYKPDLIYFSHFRFFFVLPKQLPINIFVSWNDLKWISFSFNQSPICCKKIYSLISFYSNTSSLHHPHPLRPLPPSFSSSSEDEKMWSSMTTISRKTHNYQLYKVESDNCSLQSTGYFKAYYFADVTLELGQFAHMTCDVCWGNAPGCPLCHLNANVSRMEQPSLRQLERIPVLTKQQFSCLLSHLIFYKKTSMFLR